MPEQSIVAKRQSDALKLEALRLYFDFRQGRPTAESVAEKLGVSVHTVKSWLSDNANAEILDEIVPLWPNIGSARQYASEHVQAALETLVGSALVPVRPDALAGGQHLAGSGRRARPDQ